MGICKRLDHMDNIPKNIKGGWATALNEKYRRHSITPKLRLPPVRQPSAKMNTP